MQRSQRRPKTNSREGQINSIGTASWSTIGPYFLWNRIYNIIIPHWFHEITFIKLSGLSEFKWFFKKILAPLWGFLGRLICDNNWFSRIGSFMTPPFVETHFTFFHVKVRKNQKSVYCPLFLPKNCSYIPNLNYLSGPKIQKNRQFIWGN